MGNFHCHQRVHYILSQLCTIRFPGGSRKFCQGGFFFFLSLKGVEFLLFFCYICEGDYYYNFFCPLTIFFFILMARMDFFSWKLPTPWKSNGASPRFIRQKIIISQISRSIENNWMHLNYIWDYSLLPGVCKLVAPTCFFFFNYL